MNKLKTIVVNRLLPIGVIASSALVAASAHAQVTFSATAPQNAIQAVYDGALGFFYANAPQIILTVVALSLATAFIALIARKLRGATRGV